MAIVSHITSDNDVKERLQEEAYSETTHTAKRAQPSLAMVALRISSVLQTTLEINQLITFFGQQILAKIHQVGLRFTSPDIGVDITLGHIETTDEFCHQLIVNNESLGTLRIFRDKTFGKNDSTFLDYALCGLLYPLRNAIMYQKALYLARRDTLTGLNNRACFDDNLRREMVLARRKNDPLSLIVIDIDHFKRINDIHGHSAGDHIIKSVATCIGECTRSSDMLYRWGGEEFVIILSSTEVNGAMLLAERIRTSIEQSTYTYDNMPINITVSIGITSLTVDDDEASLFTRADTALLSAKAFGRNQIQKDVVPEGVAVA